MKNREEFTRKLKVFTLLEVNRFVESTFSNQKTSEFNEEFDQRIEDFIDHKGEWKI